MTMRHPIQIIQGGQYGSEAKGAVAAHLAVTEDMNICVRTGATNAGHTAYHPDTGDKWVMQQLPIGFLNPDAELVIGAGALVDPEILRREIAEILERTGEDITRRLRVDYRAYLHFPQHARRSKESGRHVAIGATGKGCSEALIARLRERGQSNFTIGKHAEYLDLDLNLCDTEKYLNESWDRGAKIQLEGTQGQLLDLVLGPYPYTTHKQTGPGQWMLEAGLSPSIPTDIVMVVRTFPIRVAGNSGPLPNETSWPTLVRGMNWRRDKAGLSPLVEEESIRLFEQCVTRATASFDVPDGSDGNDQHKWSDRARYAEALSNLNRLAMEIMYRDYPAAFEDVRRIFEMTTVTRKLRRIAGLDHGTLGVSARQMRPHRVVVTFLNYQFPEYWGDLDEYAGRPGDVSSYLDSIGETCRAPVTMVNTGPLPRHFYRV